MAVRDITLAASDLKDGLDFFVKKLALDVVANLRAEPTNGGTPVDTGFARANWLPRIGQPAEKAVGTRPAKKGDPGVDESGVEAGIAEIATLFRIGIGNIYITNHVPYVAALNAGSSRQAPAGFIERAILKAVIEDSKK